MSPTLRERLAQRAVAGRYGLFMGIGPGLAILGLILFVQALFAGHAQADRAWQLFHVNWIYFTGLAAGSVAFAAVQKITNAKWSGMMIRFSEACVAFLPVSLVGLILIFTAGYESVYGPMEGALHELQHAVQAKEGFAAGTNPQAAIEPGLPGFDIYQAAKQNLRDQRVRLTKGRLEDLQDKTGREAYRRSAGETEARNVTERRDFSPEERNARAPWNTQDVPNDEQLVHYINQGKIPQGLQTLTEPPLFTKANKAAPSIESVGREAPKGGGVLPGIYASPKRLAQEAEAMVEPEHPSMREIFGVNRGDLYDISQGGTRAGNAPPNYTPSPAPRGVNYVAAGIMNPYNEARLQDQLSYGLAHAPNLRTGMVPWYVMDPAFQFLEQRIGRDAAIAHYKQFNTIVPMFSPGSAVPVEINRGTRANMMINQGKWDQFAKYGGVAEDARAGMPDFPPELEGMKSHVYHKTSQVIPVEKYLKAGKVVSDNPKVPLYSQATGVPETGFQAERFIPDTHVAGSLGAPEVRKTAARTGFLEGAEYNALGPWYEEKIAHPLGIRSVPMQGFQWGLYAPATGVKTGIGQPKLELLSQAVWERAKRLGVDPKQLMEDVLTGKSHASYLLPGAGGAALAAGAMNPDEPMLPR
jgi:hypothetical protein